MPDQLQITPGERLDVLERTPAVLVLEAAYAPRGSAPPAHYHPAQDERFDILRGTLRVEVAGATRDLQAGETLEIPRGTPHRMWNPHQQPARARWETRPAGRTEAWFTALADLQGTDHVAASGTPKPLPFAALAHAYRDTIRLATGPEPATRLAVAALALTARVTGRAPQHPPRDLGALSAPLAGLAFLGGLGAGVAIADDPYPRPGTKPASIRRYFQGNARAARISATGQLISAALLARFTATAARLARESGQSPTLRAATTATGAAAAASLATSGAISLTLTGPAGTRKRTLAALHRRLFIAGGPIHTAAFGALVGCLSLAGRRSGRLPAPLTTAGLASAAAGALSPLGLAFQPAVLLIPAARMSGLLVIAIAGTRLSRTPAAAAHDQPPSTRLTDGNAAR
jgi:mannose-6-phosphate isomerase-like protein (cupin superfamily)